MTLTPSIRFLALAAVSALALLGAPKAQAQSIGVPCVISPLTLGTVVVYNSGPPNVTMPLGLCASEATLAGINDYLQTGQAQSIPGRAAAAAGMSTGVVGQIALMNSQESNFRNQSKNDLANEDVRDRALAVEDAISRSVFDATTPISRRACYSTVASGGGGGASGGGASAANAGKVAGPIQKEVLTSGTENDYVARIVNSAGYALSCTSADVTNKVPGCTAEGDYPGMNTTPFILVRAYTGRSGEPSSYTIKDNPSDPLFQGQQGYLMHSKPLPGPGIREGIKDSPSGRRHLVMQRRYNSRSLAVVGAMSQIAGQTLALPENSPFVTNVWNRSAIPGQPTLREDFASVYGNGAIPAVPSEREVMNLMVLRQFTQPQASSDMVPDPLEIARRQLEVKKINSLLLLKMNEKAEWNNILYAHILSNRIDPVDRRQLLNSASTAN